MNICMFSGSFLPKVGGMEFVIHHLADTLAGLGHQVTVLSKVPPGRLDVTGPEARYMVTRYGFNLPLAGRSGANTVSSVIQALVAHRQRRFDILHCHSASHSGSRAVIIKQLLNLPLIVTPHGEDVQRIPAINYGLRLKPKWDQKIRQTLNRADAVTVISESIKRELDFLPDEKIFMIPNGIDLSDFEPDRTADLAEDLKLAKDTKVILSVGRNHAKKGYELGIEAFKRLITRLPDPKLVYVIVGRDTQKLSNKVQELGLDGKVYLLPNQERKKILRYYRSAWCFFSPSIVEGLSMVSIEAMAAGLPLVVSNVPGNCDIVSDNHCGIIVDNQNPESMAAGLGRLLANAPLYELLAATCTRSAAKYDWPVVAQKYLAAYHTAMDRAQNGKRS